MVMIFIKNNLQSPKHNLDKFEGVITYRCSAREYTFPQLPIVHWYVLLEDRRGRRSFAVVCVVDEEIRGILVCFSIPAPLDEYQISNSKG